MMNNDRGHVFFSATLIDRRGVLLLSPSHLVTSADGLARTLRMTVTSNTVNSMEDHSLPTDLLSWTSLATLTTT